MKVKTLQVLWHGKDPVLSVDFSPDTGLLASCGGDKEIKLWEVREDADGAPDVRHVDTLTAHSTVVGLRESEKRRDFGIVTWRTEGRNQKDEAVVSYQRTNLIAKRRSG